MIEEKQKHIKHINVKKSIYGITGPLSGILPETEVLVSYSDSSLKHMVIDESNVNTSENPLTGNLDVTIKLSLRPQGS